MQITEFSIKGAVDDGIARAVAIGALFGIALIHVLQLPAAFASIGYLGGLFIAAIVACLVLAAILTRTSDDRVWAAAGGLAGLILLGYVISRSIGLPGFTDDKGDWSETLGLASMVVEGLAVVLAGAVLASRHARPFAMRSTEPASTSASTMRPGPATG
jgi:hypothetical protein